MGSRRTANGTLRRSVSPHLYRLVIAAKKKIPEKPTTYRVCADFRSANKNLKPVYQRIPTFEGILDALDGTQYMTSLDIKSAYNAVSLHESCKHLLAHATPYGNVEWNVLPFGLPISLRNIFTTDGKSSLGT